MNNSSSRATPCTAPRGTPGAALLLPNQRPIPQHLGQPQPLRLPSVQDRLDDLRRKTGERQEPAAVGVRYALLLRKGGDRLGSAALDPTPPPMRTDERLETMSTLLMLYPSPTLSKMIDPMSLAVERGQALSMEWTVTIFA